MSPANRYQSSMANLAQALASGLDPQQGFSIWNDLESQHAQTLAAQQTQLDSLRQLAVQRAQQGVPFDQVQTEFQGLMPHMSQKLSMGIDDTLTSLYPSGVPGQPGRDSQFSTLAPPPDPTLNPSYVAPFTTQSVDAIGQTAASVIQSLMKPSPTNPNPQFPDLDAVKKAVAVNNIAEYQTYQPQADSVIEQIYKMMGGQVGTPIIGNMLSGVSQALGSGAPNRLGY